MERLCGASAKDKRQLNVISDLLHETGSAARSFAEYIVGGNLRLGVTGLSRSGKTVFITALVHHLTRLAAGSAAEPRKTFPVFRVHAEGRLLRARLEPQPDDQIPRFAVEEHVAALTGGAAGPEARRWPESTRRISELRVTIEFERGQGWRRGESALTLDIVDYPGEWLLDLPLLAKDYGQWSRETIEAAGSNARALISAPWRGFLASLDPAEREDEEKARKAAELFTAYLRACRDDRYALSTLPPGRFLMPGDMEGSPALTFAPLAIAEGETPRRGTLAAMMERRYEAYRTHVVRPFFRDHFCATRPADRARRCAERTQLRPRRRARSRNRDDGRDDGFSRRTLDAAVADLPPAHRPHSVCRDEGRSPAPLQPRQAGSDPARCLSTAPSRGRRTSARRSTSSP